MSATICWLCSRRLDRNKISGERVFELRHYGGDQVRVHKACAKAMDRRNDAERTHDLREFARDRISTDMVVLAEDR